MGGVVVGLGEWGGNGQWKLYLVQVLTGVRLLWWNGRAGERDDALSTIPSVLTSASRLPLSRSLCLNSNSTDT